MIVPPNKSVPGGTPMKTLAALVVVILAFLTAVLYAWIFGGQ
jgi:hypothetical protein